MPVVPDFIERLIVLRLNQGPGPMVDLLGALAYKAASIAYRLDLFEVLSDGPLTAGQVARRIDADERGTTLLLRAMEAIGYVENQDGRYSNTPMTAKWMLRSSPNHISDIFRYFEDVLERWDYLDQVVRKGEPPFDAWEWMDQRPGAWKRYNATMMSMARMADEEILARVKLPGSARRLLDVGGGHGLHSINFCHLYPELSATIIDWPQTRLVAEENIAAAAMNGRVVFHEGDYWHTDLGNGYDAALMFNIIHMYQSEKNIELLRKVADALNPGATLIILDQMATKASGPMAKAMAGLAGLELFGAVNGQTFPPGEVAEWLSKVGFSSTKVVPLRKSPGDVLVVGTMPG